MEVYQAYSGKIRNGQPIISEGVALPEDARIILMVLNESSSASVSPRNQNTLLDDGQAHRDAFEEFLTAMTEIDDEPLDEEFDAILANRVNIARKLDL